jgi:uncharacterized protein YbcI
MAATKTQGEVEAQIGADFAKFYATLFTRGPKHIQVNMLPASAVVVTQNNFTSAEKQILQPSILYDDSGRKMFKDMRARIIAANREQLTEIIENAAGVGVTSMHHDMSTVTGEEAFIFSLRDKPEYRLNHNGHTARFRCTA